MYSLQVGLHHMGLWAYPTYIKKQNLYISRGHLTGNNFNQRDYDRLDSKDCKYR